MKTEIIIEKRERIFRIWDKFQNKMRGVEYDLENIGLLPACDKNSVLVYFSNGNISLINVSYDDCVIMEFIGARDKNKKNIYDLDMVKWRVQLGEDESIKRNDYIFGLVVWSKNECGFIVEQLTKGKFVNTFVGNVFEYDTEFYSVNGAEFNW